VVGPTGSGKSHLALYLAQACGGEIVNCDSLQLYRYFDIGTAKVPLDQRQSVPHHMIDILDPGQVSTAGDYVALARPLLAEISARGRLPVVAGGTGFYLRALLEGLFEGPTRDDSVRARLAVREQRRPGSLHRVLRRLDPQTARRIHPHDVAKTMRAIEICLIARRPAVELFRSGRSALSGYNILKLGLCPDRKALHQRLNARCERMFASGLLDEVRQILERGYSPDSKPFQSIGYQEALQVVTGKCSVAAAIEAAQRHTRQYAKRQMTWFRKEPGVLWLHGFGDDTGIALQALQMVRNFLANFS
jgi:tRNA dimethylallyltransferase